MSVAVAQLNGDQNAPLAGLALHEMSPEDLLRLAVEQGVSAFNSLTWARLTPSVEFTIVAGWNNPGTPFQIIVSRDIREGYRASCDGETFVPLLGVNPTPVHRDPHPELHQQAVCKARVTARYGQDSGLLVDEQKTNADIEERPGEYLAPGAIIEYANSKDCIVACHGAGDLDELIARHVAQTFVALMSMSLK